jgi:hypothetical protein
VPIFLTLRLRKEHPFAQTAELISPRSFDTMPMING